MISNSFFSVDHSYKKNNNKSGILDMEDSVQADDIDIEGNGENTSLIGKAR